jgi:hypothetical protein
MTIVTRCGRNPPCEEPQLSLFDKLHELARKSAVAMPAEVAT